MCRVEWREIPSRFEEFVLIGLCLGNGTGEASVCPICQKCIAGCSDLYEKTDATLALHQNNEPNNGIVCINIYYWITKKCSIAYLIDFIVRNPKALAFDVSEWFHIKLFYCDILYFYLWMPANLISYNNGSY